MDENDKARPLAPPPPSFPSPPFLPLPCSTLPPPPPPCARPADWAPDTTRYRARAERAPRRDLPGAGGADRRSPRAQGGVADWWRHRRGPVTKTPPPAGSPQVWDASTPSPQSSWNISPADRRRIVELSGVDCSSVALDIRTRDLHRQRNGKHPSRSGKPSRNVRPALAAGLSSPTHPAHLHPTPHPRSPSPRHITSAAPVPLTAAPPARAHTVSRSKLHNSHLHRLAISLPQHSHLPPPPPPPSHQPHLPLYTHPSTHTPSSPTPQLHQHNPFTPHSKPKLQLRHLPPTPTQTKPIKITTNPTPFTTTTHINPTTLPTSPTTHTTLKIYTLLYPHTTTKHHQPPTNQLLPQLKHPLILLPNTTTTQHHTQSPLLPTTPTSTLTHPTHYLHTTTTHHTQPLLPSTPHPQPPPPHHTH